MSVCVFRTQTMRNSISPTGSQSRRPDTEKTLARVEAASASEKQHAVIKSVYRKMKKDESDDQLRKICHKFELDHMAL